MQSYLTKYREQLLYLLFGALTTLVNLVSFYLCDLCGMATLLSTALAWVLSVLFAYLTNRRWVFESRVQGFAPVMKEMGEFFLCRGLSGLMDMGIMALFADALGFNKMVVKILSNVLVIILNYVASKLVIFRKADR